MANTVLETFIDLILKPGKTDTGELTKKHKAMMEEVKKLFSGKDVPVAMGLKLDIAKVRKDLDEGLAEVEKRKDAFNTALTDKKIPSTINPDTVRKHFDRLVADAENRITKLAPLLGQLQRLTNITIAVGKDSKAETMYKRALSEPDYYKNLGELNRKRVQKYVASELARQKEVENLGKTLRGMGVIDPFATKAFEDQRKATRKLANRMYKEDDEFEQNLRKQRDADGVKREADRLAKRQKLFDDAAKKRADQAKTDAEQRQKIIAAGPADQGVELTRYALAEEKRAALKSGKGRAADELAVMLADTPSVAQAKQKAAAQAVKDESERKKKQRQENDDTIAFFKAKNQAALKAQAEAEARRKRMQRRENDDTIAFFKEKNQVALKAEAEKANQEAQALTRRKAQWYQAMRLDDELAKKKAAQDGEAKKKREDQERTVNDERIRKEGTYVHGGSLVRASLHRLRNTAEKEGRGGDLSLLDAELAAIPTAAQARNLVAKNHRDAERKQREGQAEGIQDQRAVV
jgi:hypothetical protein